MAGNGGRDISEGVIHEKILMDFYTQKTAPGLHKGINRRFKFFILHLQPQWEGGGLYAVIHDGGYARGITVIRSSTYYVGFGDVVLYLNVV